MAMTLVVEAKIIIISRPIKKKILLFIQQKTLNNLFVFSKNNNMNT